MSADEAEEMQKAIMVGDEERVRRLIEAGADVNTKGLSAGSLLVSAVVYKRWESAQALRMAVDDLGFSALTSPGLGERKEWMARLRARSAKPKAPPNRFPFTH